MNPWTLPVPPAVPDETPARDPVRPLWRRAGDRPGFVFALAIAFIVGYLALDRLSYVYPFRALNITPWSPQAALAVALLMTRGRRWFPWVLATIIVADLALRDFPAPRGVGLALAVIQAASYATIGWLLNGPMRLGPDLSRQRDLVNLLAASTLGAAGGGTLAAAVLAASGIVSPREVADLFVRYWIGDTLGLIVTLPLILLLIHLPRRREVWRVARNPEFLFQIALTGGMMAVILSGGEVEPFKYFYLLFLPLIWVAVRHRLAGAVLALSLIQLGLVVAATGAGYRALAVIELQALVLSLAITGLFLGIAVDQWAATADRLQRTRRLTAAGETATALAHELNQPLSALATYADAIRMQLSQDSANAEPVLATAAHIRRLSERASAIVARFRELSQAPPETSPIEITVPLEIALSRLRERAERERVLMTIDVPAPAPVVRMDRERIALAFENLIANAIDAAIANDRTPRELGVEIRRDLRGIVHVTIADSGGGVSPEAAERIFEPFVSGKSGGLGLGLPITRSIVEAHGGAIWARAADRGIMQFWLPT